MIRGSEISIRLAAQRFFESLVPDAATEEPATLEVAPTASTSPPRPCGDPLFDCTLGGLHPGMVTLVHARLAEFRSLVLAQLVLDAARSGLRVRVMTHEVSARRFLNELFGLGLGCAPAVFDGRALTRKEWSGVAHVTTELCELEITFVTQAGWGNSLEATGEERAAVDLIVTDDADCDGTLDGDGARLPEWRALAARTGAAVVLGLRGGCGGWRSRCDAHLGLQKRWWGPGVMYAIARGMKPLGVPGGEIGLEVNRDAGVVRVDLIDERGPFVLGPLVPASAASVAIEEGSARSASDEPSMQVARTPVELPAVEEGLVRDLRRTGQRGEPFEVRFAQWYGAPRLRARYVAFFGSPLHEDDEAGLRKVLLGLSPRERDELLVTWSRSRSPWWQEFAWSMDGARLAFERSCAEGTDRQGPRRGG